MANPVNSEPVIGSFKERCAAHAEEKLKQACRLPPGSERNDLEREARQLRIASELNEWLNSPGLRPPEK